MRSLVLVMLLVVLAASASAEPRGRRHIFAPQPTTSAGLRGAQHPPDEAPSDGAAAMIAVPTALPSVAGQPAADVGQCRRSCARSYYFCLASDSPDDCGPTWSQCASSCSGPSYSLPPPP
jgi:hypothetical protein